MADLPVRLPFHDTRSVPIVGRDRERALLRDRLNATLAGRGSLVLIGGEAGIGKTALAEALCAEATDQGALVLVGRCYDLTETPPYGPWTELFASLIADRDAARLPAPLGEGEAVASQAALFAAVHDHLRAMAARQPLVLLLDDLHWADPASLDLLRTLARQVSGMPLLLLVTYRADELSRRHPLYQLLPLLVREAGAIQLDLRPLPDDAVRELVRTRYALSAADEDRLTDYLRDRAEGHPFFLGELLNTLEEVGDLSTTGDGWRLGDLGALRVPRLLRQVVEGRLARLSEEDQRLLAVAAVLGQEVPLWLWATVAGTDEDALLDTVERAVEARLLEALRAGDAVRFAHALVREVLYEGTLPMRRRRLHRAAAEAVAATANPDPDAVAYHLQRAGDPRAAEWLIRAGERAQRAYAWLTAAERYQAALALLPDDVAHAGERGWLYFHLGPLRHYGDQRQGLTALDEAARLAALAGDRALAAASLVERGALQMSLGNVEGLSMLEAGARAVDALVPGERARLNLRATLGAETPDLNPYWGMLARMRAFSGPYPEVLALGERFVAQAPAPSAGPGLGPAFAGYVGGAYRAIGMAHAQLGRPAAARRALAEARVAFALAGDPVHLGETATQELALLALPYEPERVAERRRLADEVAEQFGRAGGMGMASPRHTTLSLLALEGRWAEGRALAEEGVIAANLSGGRAFARRWLGQLSTSPEVCW